MTVGLAPCRVRSAQPIVARLPSKSGSDPLFREQRLLTIWGELAGGVSSFVVNQTANAAIAPLCEPVSTPRARPRDCQRIRTRLLLITGLTENCSFFGRVLGLRF